MLTLIARTYTFIALLTIILATSIAATAQTTDPTASTTAQIVKARNYTSEFVSLAKQRLSSPDKSADLDQSRKLYAEAFSDYSAWVAYMKTALRDGKAKNLNRDAEYLKVAADASAAATHFTAFVDSKTGQSKAVTAILASLADLGLRLYNGIKDRKDKDRAAAADAFEKDAQWQPWDKVGTTDSSTPKKDDSSANKKDDTSTPAKDSSTPTPTPKKKNK